MTRKDAVLAGFVALVLFAGLGLLGWWLWPDVAAGEYRVARGVVVDSAVCDVPGARDALQVDLLDGRDPVPAQLDGCGNVTGEVLTVEVPDPLPAENVTARLAGTGVPEATVTAQRVSAVLVGVAGAAGAVLAWRLRHGRA